ncbi:MAG: polyprenyl synthetase family protein [Tannerellaceae bacterium]
MYTFNEILAQVESVVTHLEFNTPPKSLFDPIEYILSLGGKRVRPALTLMACNVFTDQIEKALSPAIGVEVFHNFTLLHDDLMDCADMRRGNETVHIRWSPNVAILSGDAMLIESYKLMSNAPSEYLKEVLDLFSTTATEVCAGQQFDMEFESRAQVAEDEYLEMIRLKTAVLLACALKIGAIIGGASQQDATLLYDFGINLGLAFQLQDDLLDVYGDPKVFGKSIGGDICSNKKTYMLINALNKASDTDRMHMNEWFSFKTFDKKEKIEFFTYIYDTYGIRKMAERKVAQYFDAAMLCLEKISVPSDNLSALRELSQMLMGRKS